MVKTPLISIIIPTYNRADKLRDAIDSVYNQTYKNIQLIVIDDGSIDHTDYLIKEFPLLEYIKQDHTGSSAARNKGLKHAKGELIASLDSDDVWEPTFLERCVTKLLEDQFDFVFANWIQDSRDEEEWDFLLNDPFLIPYFKESQDNWIPLSPKDLREIYMVACPSPSSSVVVKKSSIVSGWDEGINVGDDWCLYLDIILNKECRAAFTLDKLWRKRISTNNIYDGRKRSEVLKFCFIEDTLLVMKKFEKVLTTKEMNLLKKRYVSALVELAKHELIRERNLKEAYRLLKISSETNIIYTINTIPNLLMIGIQGKYESIFNIKHKQHKKQPPLISKL